MGCDFLTRAVVGLSTVTILKISYRNWKRNDIPSKWTPVGQISELYCFPIKSGGVIPLQEILCANIGAKNEFLRDRTFMVIDENERRFVTARQYPLLVKIQPEVNEHSLKLSFSAVSSSLSTLTGVDNSNDVMLVDMDRVLASNDTLIAEIWDKAYVEVFDCGDDVAEWISNIILNGSKKGLRLVYYPLNHPTRPVRPKNRIFPEMSSDHVGALHDASSFMMINESSVEELNSRLNFKVNPLLFRPNLVLKGPQAFDEDRYKWVKIGQDTVMKVLKPCTRCVFTNVDPMTGQKRSDGEPLKTLKEYRKFPGLGDSPVMGVHLGVIAGGIVKVGDQVFVGED